MSEGQRVHRRRKLATCAIHSWRYSKASQSRAILEHSHRTFQCLELGRAWLECYCRLPKASLHRGAVAGIVEWRWPAALRTPRAPESARRLQPASSLLLLWFAVGGGGRCVEAWREGTRAACNTTACACWPPVCTSAGRQEGEDSSC